VTACAVAAVAAVSPLALAGGVVPCDADIDGDGNVAFADLTLLLAAWGPCEG